MKLLFSLVALCYLYSYYCSLMLYILLRKQKKIENQITYLLRFMNYHDNNYIILLSCPFQCQRQSRFFLNRFLEPLFFLYSSGFNISPKVAITPMGDTMRLNCTYVSNNKVNWKHRPLGDGLYHAVYDQWLGMPKNLLLGGRHTIEQSSGRCDLVITNITSDDAGTYECNDDYEKDGDDVELIVLGDILHFSEYFNCIIYSVHVVYLGV